MRIKNNRTYSNVLQDILGDDYSSRPGKGVRRVRKVRKNAQRLASQRLRHSDPEMAVFAAGAKMQDQDNSVVLGVYSAEEWVYSETIKKRFLNNQKTVQLSGTWLTNSDFNLAAWVQKTFETYTFFGNTSVSCFTKTGGIVKVVHSRNKIDVEVISDPEEANFMIQHFKDNFKQAENMIEWVYTARGDEIQVPLNYRPAIRAAYPWIDPSYTNLTDYIDEYIDSDASVLILIGPPGTGKTTFIKNIIHRSKANAKVAYDPAVMMQDGFFAGFVGDDCRFLVMEDSDEFLRSRSDGNSMMHKFLNVSDGLISASDKKIIFSTNLPNVRDIDEALMRPGRCFDVVQFRELTRVESTEVLKEIRSDKELPDGDKFSLATLFSTQPASGNFVRRKIGFVS